MECAIAALRALAHLIFFINVKCLEIIRYVLQGASRHRKGVAAVICITGARRTAVR